MRSENDEADSIVKKVSSNSLSINGQDFTFDSIAHIDATQVCFLI